MMVVNQSVSARGAETAPKGLLFIKGVLRPGESRPFCFVVGIGARRKENRL